MKEQEKSWQEKFRAESEESKVMQMQQAGNLEQIKGDEQRKSMEFQQKANRQQQEEQDQMARKRYNDQLQQQQEAEQRKLQMQAQANEQERQKRLQAVTDQENAKRGSMEYQAQLDRETQRQLAKQQGIAAAEQERENKEIRSEQIRIKAAEDRTTDLETLRESFKLAGEAVTDYLSDPMKMGATVGVVTGLALGIYGVRAASNIGGKYFAARLMQPPLVRDTSRRAGLNPFGGASSASTGSAENSLSGMVLEPSLERRLRDITVSTARTKKHGAQYRNLMLYGPPGTGKTMFAMKLAKQSGLDYAVLAGGDVAPLGATAITELHRVFDWGESSKSGLVLFVDEAESFLRKRGADQEGEMSENMRNALSTFLYRTGTPSDKVMLVLATNEPGEFDRAVTDRVDEAVLFALPGVDERTKLLEKYFNENVRDPSRHIVVADDVPTGDWVEMAEELEGLSGRQIMKLSNAWQASAYASNDNTLTRDMLFQCIINHRHQQDTKDEWAKL